MTYDEELAGRVRGTLARTPRVVEKKMFGGVAFMVNGKMCVTVGQSGIMCRIDPTIQSGMARQKGCRPVIMRGREYTGYVRVNKTALQTREALEKWVRLALEYNRHIRHTWRKQTN